jgi:hypothetical protein
LQVASYLFLFALVIAEDHVVIVLDVFLLDHLRVPLLE